MERQAKDLALAAAPGGHPRGLWWDAEAAERPIIFIERYCKHHKAEWAGKPLLLEPWEKDIIRILFGWKRADGTRRYRKAWIEVARKNGKTELGAALALYLLLGDNEPGGEIYFTATKIEQAKILWDAAAAMVRASPELSGLVKVHRSQGGTLFCERLGSKARPLSADYGTLDGLSPSGDFRDEIHAWKDHRLAGVLDTAMGARRQPLTFEITTAGVYDPEAVGWQHHEYATNVLDGHFEDDRQFAYIAALDEEDDALDPANWGKANPNLGISPKLSYITEQADLARRQPTKMNDFLRLHCNRWTQQITRWLSTEKWNVSDLLTNEQALAVRADRESALVGRPCYGGLDLSSRLDVTALVLAFFADDGVIDLLCRFWLPEETVVEQAKKGRRHYEQWVREGWITTTSGNVVDYDAIRQEIGELSKRYQFREVGFDNWNATQLATQLGGDGFSMVQLRQGFQSLSEPSKAFEAAIVDGKIRHGGNPVLRWMVGNAVIKRDAAGNIKPDKEKASDKIDGVVAAIMALARGNVATDGCAYSPTVGLISL